MANTARRADLEKQALEILQNPAARLTDVMDLAAALKARRSFGDARRLYSRAQTFPEASAQSSLGLKLAQQEALCTYQDPDQPANARYDRALEILSGVQDLQTTTDQETLGITGAIYKRKWQTDGQIENLYRALAYYRRGH